MLEVRHGKLEEIDTIMDIYAAAREIMRSSGNPNQWGTTNPPREVVINEIKEGHNYVITNGDTICASFFFNVMEDPTYLVIEDGSWLNDSPYGVIHRIGSDGTCKGVLETALNFAFTKTNNIRIDTHNDNKIMQHLLVKNGFTKCGIIHLLNGDPRIAFQKFVGNK